MKCSLQMSVIYLILLPKAVITAEGLGGRWKNIAFEKELETIIVVRYF